MELFYPCVYYQNEWYLLTYEPVSFYKSREILKDFKDKFSSKSYLWNAFDSQTNWLIKPKTYDEFLSRPNIENNQEVSDNNKDIVDKKSKPRVRRFKDL